MNFEEGDLPFLEVFSWDSTIRGVHNILHKNI